MIIRPVIRLGNDGNVSVAYCVMVSHMVFIRSIVHEFSAHHIERFPFVTAAESELIDLHRVQFLGPMAGTLVTYPDTLYRDGGRWEIDIV